MWTCLQHDQYCHCRSLGIYLQPVASRSSAAWPSHEKDPTWQVWSVLRNEQNVFFEPPVRSFKLVCFFFFCLFFFFAAPRAENTSRQAGKCHCYLPSLTMQKLVLWFEGQENSLCLMLATQKNTESSVFLFATNLESEASRTSPVYDDASLCKKAVLKAKAKNWPTEQLWRFCTFWIHNKTRALRLSASSP